MEQVLISIIILVLGLDNIRLKKKLKDKQDMRSLEHYYFCEELKKGDKK